MTDKEKLTELIENSGLRRSFIYDKLGMSRSTFSKKLNNINPWTVPEVAKLCSILGINSRDMAKIFLTTKLNK